MENNKQVTTIGDAKQVVDKLQSYLNLLTATVTTLSGLNIKLKIDLSPDCYEYGPHADFIKDCRDKLLPKAMMDLISFIACINGLKVLIDPELNQTNADYKKEEAAFEAQYNQQ